MFWNKKEKQNNSAITSSRTFSYKKRNCNLSFSLNMRNKEEMEDFIELLEVAIKEVNEEIEK